MNVENMHSAKIKIGTLVCSNLQVPSRAVTFTPIPFSHKSGPDSQCGHYRVFILLLNTDVQPIFVLIQLAGNLDTNVFSVFAGWALL
jgi:hypothetical protein